MPQPVIIQPSDIVGPDIIGITVARAPDIPATDPLLICTGTAVFDFEGTDDGITRGGIVFFIPEETDTDPLKHPLDVGPILGRRLGTQIHEATIASLTSFSGDTAPWAVDAVEVVLFDGGGGKQFLQLAASLAVGKGSHILRMSYQANILFFVP
jgi:hypothetical protein